MDPCGNNGPQLGVAFKTRRRELFANIQGATAGTLGFWKESSYSVTDPSRKRRSGDGLL